MKILWGEMRRYWQPLLLVLCGVLTAFFCLFVNQSAQRFGTYFRGQSYALTRDFYERFGTTLDRAERAQIVSESDALSAEFDGLFDKYLGKYDIHSETDYDLLTLAANDETDEQYDEAAARWGAENLVSLHETCEAMIHEKIDTMYYKDRMNVFFAWTRHFTIFDEIVEEYRTTGTVEMGFEGTSQQVDHKALAPLLADLDKDEISLLTVINQADTFRETYLIWALLLFLLCALLTAPLLVTNRIRNIQPLQFASRQGKSMIFRQITAALLSSALVNIAADFIFYRVFFCGAYDTRFLLDCPINAGTLGEMYRLNLTYGQFVLLSFVNVLVLSLLLTGTVLAASYYCKNYISAIAVSTVLTILGWFWCQKLFRYGRIYHSYRLPFPVVAVLPTVVVLAAVMFLLVKVRQSDYTE